MRAEARRLAHAKVNPFLRVLGARADGYHEIETLIHPIDLADEITVRPADGLVVSVEGPEAEGVPVGPDNLVHRAASELARACGVAAAAEIHVVKRIPAAAGLGGGSADAAATIDALAELWDCAPDPAARSRVAESIGSDVPAMLHEGPVLAAGRGERLVPMDIAPCRWRVIPAEFGIASSDAYRWWDEDGAETGPDPARLVDALAVGDLELAGRLLFNDLEAPILRRFPHLEGTKARLLAEGAMGAVVSGSGPSVAGLYPPV